MEISVVVAPVQMIRTGKEIKCHSCPSIRILDCRGTPYYDKAFYEMYRRRMEFDRQRYNSHSHYQSYPNNVQQNYFGAVSIVLIVISFGMFIHALQWR